MSRCQLDEATLRDAARDARSARRLARSKDWSDRAISTSFARRAGCLAVGVATGKLCKDSEQPRPARKVLVRAEQRDHAKGYADGWAELEQIHAQCFGTRPCPPEKAKRAAQVAVALVEQVGRATRKRSQ